MAYSSRSASFLTEDPQDSPNGTVHELFPPQRSQEEDVLADIHPIWKRNLFALVEQPTSSPSAFLIHVLTIVLILTSAVVTVLETVPAFHSISTRVWFGMETSLVAMFTVEYIARCLAWSTSWRSLFRWMFSFFGIIDLLSVLPYYVEILLQQDTSVFFRFSILRMFRLLRVFRPFRYNHTILLHFTHRRIFSTIEVMYLSVRRSQHALFAIGFFVVMVLTVFSTLLYFAERGTWDEVLGTFINSDGDPTQFSSIPAAAWFVLVTITTVGYGEITPRSFLGRLVTLPILVFGLLLITLPSFVLGREFSLVWNRMNKGRLSKASDEEDFSFAADPHNPNEALLHVETPHSNAPADLSNMKLAQNQTELSRQISELSATVETQGKLIRRLIEVLEKGGGGLDAPAGTRKGKGKLEDEGGVDIVI
ncbi:hypothetical protein BDQ12DRAFT_700737 [Crucibulum laeve]|uniref:Ion transport domain-containing protein n=1 Tax=Crucibulum laeve TaxID=68775 RepID=A0A5C3LK00_9AGAR|nr:hypothetical protein BDQ12DRAFT_700737 [Crucibulum laeve]